MNELFLVLNDQDFMEMAFLSIEEANEYIEKFGNDGYTIQTDVVC